MDMLYLKTAVWQIIGVLLLSDKLISIDHEPGAVSLASLLSNPAKQSMSFDSTFLDLEQMVLPTLEGSLYAIASTEPSIRHKREAMKLEICPSVHSWISIANATNIKGRNVKIAQKIANGRKQWFYSVKCTADMENQRCRLIDKKYSACCETKHHFIPAIVVAGRKYKWDMVALPSQCVCLQTVDANATAAGELKKDRWKVKIHF